MRYVEQKTKKKMRQRHSKQFQREVSCFRRNFVAFISKFILIFCFIHSLYRRRHRLLSRIESKSFVSHLRRGK